MGAALLTRRESTSPPPPPPADGWDGGGDGEPWGFVQHYPLSRGDEWAACDPYLLAWELADPEPGDRPVIVEDCAACEAIQIFFEERWPLWLPCAPAVWWMRFTQRRRLPLNPLRWISLAQTSNSLRLRRV